MKKIKFLLMLVILNTSFSCNEKSNKKLDISNFFEIYEEKDSYVKGNKSSFESFKNKTNVNYANLIRCNMPFDLGKDFNMIIHFNEHIVFNGDIDERIKIPNSLNDGEIVNVSITFITDKNVYRISNKNTFLLSTDIKYYYLSFYPFNDSTDRFLLIPSSEYIA